MKYLFLLLVLSVMLFSCEKEELVYSCDPEINAIVKSATVEFSEITLSEFLEYDIALQKAIFRSFNSEKMRGFWIEKLDSVLINSNFDIQEKAHIELLKAELTPGYFDITPMDSVELEERLQFSENWSTYATDSLNWSKDRINFIRYSLYLTEEQYILSRDDLFQNSLSTMQMDCNCSSEADDCLDFGLNCVEGACSSTSVGCGTFWTSPCTGGCE